MSESTNSPATLPMRNNGQAPAGPFDNLWGFWKKEKEWQTELYHSAAHKALDIPEGMGINAPKMITNGIGWKELLVLAGAGLGGFYLWDQAHEQPTPPAAVDTDTTNEYLIKPLPGE